MEDIVIVTQTTAGAHSDAVAGTIVIPAAAAPATDKRRPTNHLNLANRVFGVPLMIAPQKLEIMLRGELGKRLGVRARGEFERPPLDAYYDDDEDDFGSPAVKKSYNVTAEGIAVIPVQGTLMKKVSGMWAWSGCGSYQKIGQQVKDAANDKAIKGILLDIDSPGGETTGCFELCDTIYSLRGEKPIYAAANDFAFSAAYAIASSAERIFVTRVGGVGSVGVYCCYADESGYDEKQGLKYNYIFFGDKKIDGNPHEPLSRSARKDAQDEVDRQGNIFVNTVARNRKTGAKAIVDTQAGTYSGENALPLLADQVGTIDDALGALTEKATGRRPISGAAGAPHPAAVAAPKGAEADMDRTQPGAEAETPLPAAVTTDPTDPCEEEEEEMKDDMKDKETATAAAAAAPATAAAPPAEASRVVDISTRETPNSVAVEIANQCKIAGRRELALDFIADGKTLAQVQAELLRLASDESAKSNVASVISQIQTSGLDTLEQQASALATSKGLTKAKAYEQLLKRNPKLYDAYLAERNMMISSPQTADRYMSTLGQRFPDGKLA